MNIIDVAVIAIIVGCVLFFSYKGLVMALFGALSAFLSFYLAQLFAPRVTEVLRNQPVVFDTIKNTISDKMGLSALADAATKSAETWAINSLGLPGFLKDTLLENNNPEIRSILNANSFDEYVSSFLANLFLGVLVMVLLFIVILVALKITSVILDIASRLPIINAFNKIGGAVIGVVVGVLAAYALLALSSLFLASGKYPDIVQAIESSRFASFFFHNNFITSLISGAIGK